MLPECSARLVDLLEGQPRPHRRLSGMGGRTSGRGSCGSQRRGWTAERAAAGSRPKVRRPVFEDWAGEGRETPWGEAREPRAGLEVLSETAQRRRRAGAVGVAIDST